MLTFEQRKAAVLRALMKTTAELERHIKARAQLDAAAKNLAAMPPEQRKAFIGAIMAKLNRIEREIAAAQATRAAQPRPVARKTAPAAQRPTATRISRQADELLRDSFARKSMPVGCSGPTCNRMRTPTGGRR